ncbi:MAG TPA: helix-turn-helix domain-containing protein [Thermoanaerobaculia bacterium]|nr:helix-turn-helix domain-containing protein [Thermoanaerobaculia bacterium]
MSACLNCASDYQKKTMRRPHRYVESGLSFVLLTNMAALVCKCGEQPWLPDARSLSHAITEQLIRRPLRLTFECVRFLRKAFGMTSDEFAVLLGTTRQEVSRWENDRAQISGLMDLRLRLEVIDKVLPPRAAHRQLRDAVVAVMVKRVSSEDPTDNGGDIVIDATPHYSRKGSRGDRQPRIAIGAGAGT